MGKILDYIKIRHQCPADFSERDLDELFSDMSELPDAQPRPNTGIKKPQGEKGIVNGVKYDSKWEYLFYLYKHDIEGMPIERNRTEWIQYNDDAGKPRKFYPDFVCGGEYYEVKGFYRGNDICKMSQHPEVHFIDKTNILPMIAEVKKRYPNWEKDYMPRYK